MTEGDQIDHQRSQGVDLSLKGLDTFVGVAHSEISSEGCGDRGDDAESPGRETDPAAERPEADRTDISGFAVFGAPVSDEVAADRFDMWMFKQGPWAACPRCEAPLFPRDVHRCDR